MPHVDIQEIPKPSHDLVLATGVAELIMMELAEEPYTSPMPERLKNEFRYMEGVVTVAATYEGPRVVATASMRQRRFMPEEATVIGVVTSFEERKNGLGKRVMGHLEEIARGRDIKKLMLTSSPSAMAFYEKLGFEKQYQYIDGSRDFVKIL